MCIWMGNNVGLNKDAKNVPILALNDLGLHLVISLQADTMHICKKKPPKASCLMLKICVIDPDSLVIACPPLICPLPRVCMPLCEHILLKLICGLSCSGK